MGPPGPLNRPSTNTTQNSRSHGAPVLRLRIRAGTALHVVSMALGGMSWLTFSVPQLRTVISMALDSEMYGPPVAGSRVGVGAGVYVGSGGGGAQVGSMITEGIGLGTIVSEGVMMRLVRKGMRVPVGLGKPAGQVTVTIIGPGGSALGTGVGAKAAGSPCPFSTDPKASARAPAMSRRKRMLRLALRRDPMEPAPPLAAFFRWPQ